MFKLPPTAVAARAILPHTNTYTHASSILHLLSLFFHLRFFVALDFCRFDSRCRLLFFPYFCTTKSTFLLFFQTIHSYLSAIAAVAYRTFTYTVEGAQPISTSLTKSFIKFKNSFNASVKFDTKEGARTSFCL